MIMDSADTRRSTRGVSKRTFAALAVLVAACLGLAGGGVVWLIFEALQDNPASRTAQTFVFEHPVAQENLGPPIKPDGPILGSIVEGDDTGTARLSFRMNGSRGRGHAVVTLVKAESKWHVTAVEFTGSDGVTRNLDVVLEQSPDDAAALYRRAQAQMKMGKEDSAREDVRRAVELNIDLREAYQLYDYLLAKQGRWEEIIAAWTQYLERHPDDAMALLERAGTYKHHGDMEHAFGDLRRSCELGNTQACTYLHRDKGD